jgi:DNA-binding transcriptional LysR family regulator
MDTIASMRAFVAVAKTGSFSAAAQKLDLVHPQVDELLP